MELPLQIPTVRASSPTIFNPPSHRLVRIAVLLLCFKHTVGVPDIPKVAAGMGWTPGWTVLWINTAKRPSYMNPDEALKLLLLCYQYTRGKPDIKAINEEYHCLDLHQTRRATAIKGHKQINKIIRDLKEEYAKPEEGALCPAPGTEATKFKHYGKTNTPPNNAVLDRKDLNELIKKDVDIGWIGFVELDNDIEATVEDETTTVDNKGVHKLYDEYLTEDEYQVMYPGWQQ